MSLEPGQILPPETFGFWFQLSCPGSGVCTPLVTAAGGNGVYAYGGTNTAGIFPTSSFGASNYWADVVFAASGGTGGNSVVITRVS